MAVPPLLVKAPLPAVAVSRKDVEPPFAFGIAPPLLVKMPLSAVEVPRKTVPPPTLLKPTVSPLLVKVAFPALELSRNIVRPDRGPLAVPPLLVKAVRLPVFAL